MYPGRRTVEDTAVELAVSRGIEAAISEAGEEDLYRFEVTEKGLHVIETTGSTDVVLVLFGPDSQTNKIDENDDGGAGRNSRIAADLAPGTYFAAVRHFSAHRTGNYRISVSAF